MSVRITQRIKIRGINPYVLVGAEQAVALKPGWKKPMPVLVTINGQPRKPARVNLMPAGDGSFYLYLNGPVREASATAVGDRVVARVSFDAAYRGGPTHAMPPGLRRALRAQPKRRQAWDALTPSRQKEILRYLAALRSETARERNIAKVLGMLSKPLGIYLGRVRAANRKVRSSQARVRG
jgi:hypothetical protein